MRKLKAFWNSAVRGKKDKSSRQKIENNIQRKMAPETTTEPVDLTPKATTSGFSLFSCCLPKSEDTCDVDNNPDGEPGIKSNFGKFFTNILTF